MLDLAALHSTVAAHHRVARIVVASTGGSVPREVGASMLVWASGQSGTIGGGALEWEASQRARAALSTGDRLDKVPLGPDLGQCCGGAVLLLTEIWDAARLKTVGPDAYIRPMPGYGGDIPLKLAGTLRRARSGSGIPGAEYSQGWLLEPLSVPARALWIWGAGHVGRALVAVIAQLPGVAITWIDTAPDRFPADLPAHLRLLPVPDPGLAVTLAPQDAEHLILTYSHALDLDLCHRLLSHGFASAGLIGSATKWARFRSRLAALGHTPSSIARIRCPIGDPALGKHPQAIAIGVAADFLARSTAAAIRQEYAG
jgi:xanthine dehydrogenase accessory factor